MHKARIAQKQASLNPDSSNLNQHIPSQPQFQAAYSCTFHSKTYFVGHTNTTAHQQFELQP